MTNAEAIDLQAKLAQLDYEALRTRARTKGVDFYKLAVSEALGNALDEALAQIEAANEFCESLRAYVEDEYVNTHGGKAPDVTDLNVVNTLDALARLGLRFEIGPIIVTDEDVGYFGYNKGQSCLDAILYGFAEAVAEEFEANRIIVQRRKNPSILDLITCHGCSPDNLIFVQDLSGVASRAYFMLLAPGKLLE